MINISLYSSLEDMVTMIGLIELVDFLHDNLGRFSDCKSAISKAVDYALSSEPAQGGFIMLAWDNELLAGAMVINKTGMEEYIPTYFLVYIAVRQDLQGRGTGTMMLQKALKLCEGGIALHVEHDNPAIGLYRRLGFTSKYVEMRSS